MTEHSEQAAFVAEVLYRYSNRDDFIRPLFFSVPNGAWLGGKNPHALMAKYKAEGFLPGVADILYLQPRGDWSFLAIEMKAVNRKGGVSEEQNTFIRAALSAGGLALVCYGTDSAIKAFTKYMELLSRKITAEQMHPAEPAPITELVYCEHGYIFGMCCVKKCSFNQER